MRIFYCSSEFIKRFSAFFSSVNKIKISSFSKSEYWKEQSQLINVKVSDCSVMVSGSSGFYIPPQRGTKACLLRRIKETLYPIIKRCKGLWGKEIQLLSYTEAFNYIMSNHPIAGLSSGPQRLNFKDLKKNQRAVLSVKDIRESYFAKEKYIINDQIINSFYLWNILCSQIPLDGIKTVLEIGPGNGNLSALLHYQLKAKVICVDLPEVLNLSILFISDCFPNAKILMPHEANSCDLKEYDFIFLTPQQIHLIQDNSIDLAINTDSFQEMTGEQVEEYFQLIQRAVKKERYFFTQNRVEKFLSKSEDLPLTEIVSRFSYYPWDEKNKTIIQQICPLGRLVQLDNVFIRLEKIMK